MTGKPLQLLLIACLWWCTPALALAGSISVVVSKDTKIPKASKLEVARIFLGKKKMLGGKKLKPVDYSNEDLAIVKKFRKKVLKKNSSKYKLYWSSRIFTGKGVPPKSVAKTQKEMRQYIAEHPGTIGFVDSKALTDDLKEVYRYGK